MYNRIHYTIVGLFVLLLGTGAVLFAFWLARYGFEQKYDLYKVYFTESISGLSKDSVVKLHGVEVGRVKDIRISPNDIERVEVILSIKRGIPIKADMVAHTTMLGVTGLLSIDIEGGTNEAPTLKPTKDHIPVIQTAPSWLHTAKKDFGGLIERLNNLSDKFSQVLTQENIEHFSHILAHTERLSAAGVDAVKEFNATAVAYREAIGEVQKKLERLVTRFDTLEKKTAPALDALTAAAKDFDRLSRKVEISLKRGDYNIKKIFEPLLTDIHILSAQLGDLMREMEESPSDLFFKSRKVRKGPGE
jgi:phospholipid/cholesterol/gamma-HCH transport system substrate-binding protein